MLISPAVDKFITRKQNIIICLNLRERPFVYSTYFQRRDLSSPVWRLSMEIQWRRRFHRRWSLSAAPPRESAPRPGSPVYPWPRSSCHRPGTSIDPVDTTRVQLCCWDPIKNAHFLFAFLGITSTTLPTEAFMFTVLPTVGKVVQEFLIRLQWDKSFHESKL